MQVRSIEFQESFARLPVEQSRQMHVLQKEPDLASDQVARMIDQAHLLDQSRPVPAAQVEGMIIQSEHQNDAQTGRQKRKRVAGDPPHSEPPAPPPDGRSGKYIDLIV